MAIPPNLFRGIVRFALLLVSLARKARRCDNRRDASRRRKALGATARRCHQGKQRTRPRWGGITCRAQRGCKQILIRDSPVEEVLVGFSRYCGDARVGRSKNGTAAILYQPCPGGFIFSLQQRGCKEGRSRMESHKFCLNPQIPGRVRGP